MEEKYTTNPNYKGSKEEAEKQHNEYKEMNKWLATHRDLWKYEDSRIGGFKFLCPLEEVPECLIKYDQARKEHQKQIEDAKRRYREKHGIGENEPLVIDLSDEDCPPLF